MTTVREHLHRLGIDLDTPYDKCLQTLVKDPYSSGILRNSLRRHLIAPAAIWQATAELKKIICNSQESLVRSGRRVSQLCTSQKHYHDSQLQYERLITKLQKTATTLIQEILNLCNKHQENFKELGSKLKKITSLTVSLIIFRGNIEKNLANLVAFTSSTHGSTLSEENIKSIQNELRELKGRVPKAITRSIYSGHYASWSLTSSVLRSQTQKLLKETDTIIERLKVTLNMMMCELARDTSKKVTHYWLVKLSSIWKKSQSMKICLDRKYMQNLIHLQSDVAKMKFDNVKRQPLHTETSANIGEQRCMQCARLYSDLATIHDVSHMNAKAIYIRIFHAYRWLFKFIQQRHCRILHTNSKLYSYSRAISYSQFWPLYNYFSRLQYIWLLPNSDAWKERIQRIKLSSKMIEERLGNVICEKQIIKFIVAKNAANLHFLCTKSYGETLKVYSTNILNTTRDLERYQEQVVKRNFDYEKRILLLVKLACVSNQVYQKAIINQRLQSRYLPASVSAIQSFRCDLQQSLERDTERAQQRSRMKSKLSDVLHTGGASESSYKLYYSACPSKGQGYWNRVARLMGVSNDSLQSFKAAKGSSRLLEVTYNISAMQSAMQNASKVTFGPPSVDLKQEYLRPFAGRIAILYKSAMGAKRKERAQALYTESLSAISTTQCHLMKRVHMFVDQAMHLYLIVSSTKNKSSILNTIFLELIIKLTKRYQTDEWQMKQYRKTLRQIFGGLYRCSAKSIISHQLYRFILDLFKTIIDTKHTMISQGNVVDGKHEEKDSALVSKGEQLRITQKTSTLAQFLELFHNINTIVDTQESMAFNLQTSFENLRRTVFQRCSISKVEPWIHKCKYIQAELVDTEAELIQVYRVMKAKLGQDFAISQSGIRSSELSKLVREELVTLGRVQLSPRIDIMSEQLSANHPISSPSVQFEPLFGSMPRSHTKRDRTQRRQFSCYNS